MKGGWGWGGVIQEALKCAILAREASLDAGGQTSFTFAISGGLLPPHLLGASKQTAHASNTPKSFHGRAGNVALTTAKLGHVQPLCLVLLKPAQTRGNTPLTAEFREEARCGGGGEMGTLTSISDHK